MSVQCIRLLGFDFIGIEIGFCGSIGGRISLDAVAPSAKSTEHCGNAVQFNLTFPAFLLNTETAAINVIVFMFTTTKTSWIAVHSKAEPRAISKYRLRSASAVLPLPSAQRFGLPINPGNVLYREAVNTQSFVSKSHGFSISIAIPISIWIIPTTMMNHGAVR